MFSLFSILADKDDMFTKLAYIAMENYVITRERFGQFSLEVIMSITYALNILKMANELEKESTRHQEDIAKIRKVLDIKKMEKSITILPKAMQKVFKYVFNEIKRIDQFNVDECLTKLNLSNETDTSVEDSDTID